MKVAISFTAGKDSMYTLDWAKKNNYDVFCLLADFSEYSFYPSSYRYSKNNFKLLSAVAEAVSIPMKYGIYKGASQDKKEKCIEKLYEEVSNNVDGVIVGITTSTELRDRRIKLCEKHGIEFIDPIWKKDVCEFIPSMIKDVYKIKFAAVFSPYIDKNWATKELTLDKLRQLKEISRKYGIDAGGEFKEYETIVTNGPIFKKEVKIKGGQVIDKKKNLSYFRIEEATC